MMFASLLLACRPGDPLGDADGSLVAVTEDHAVRSDEGEWDWGTTVTAGSDLDHDGRLEWAASAPRLGEDLSPYATVAVYHGHERLVARAPEPRRPEDHGLHLAAGRDVNGDGFADLIYSTEAVGYEPKFVIVTEMDPDADTSIALGLSDDEIGTDPRSVEFATVDGQLSLLLGWAKARSRRDLVNVSTIEFGTDMRTSDMGEPMSDSTDVFVTVHNTVAVDVDGDGSDEWFSGSVRYVDSETLGGTLVVCPSEANIEVPGDCQTIAEDYPDVGGEQAVGDLDGDGVKELMSSASGKWGEDGSLAIFGADGSLRAHIQGTKGAMFGYAPTVVIDDFGERWLLVGQFNIEGHERGTVYAFKGDRVVGNLSDYDADRVYQADFVSSMGRSIAAYRETPQSPLTLVFGAPADGYGAVYVVPFSPE